MAALGGGRAGRRDLDAERAERGRRALVEREPRGAAGQRDRGVRGGCRREQHAGRRDRRDESSHSYLLVADVPRLRARAAGAVGRCAKLAQPDASGVRTRLVHVHRADRRLAAGLHRRDPDALAQLHAECGSTVLGFLVRQLRDRASAEDVFQQVFLEAWQRGPTYDPDRGAPLTWIMTIARSRAIDHLRRRVPEPRDPAGSLALLEAEADPAAGIDALVEQWRVAHLLQRLPGEEARAAAQPLLRRALAARDRRGDRHPARHGEDADGPGPAPPARPDRRGGGRDERARPPLRLPARRARRGDERARFEAAAATDPALAAEVERLRPVVARLEALEPAAWEPPPALSPLPGAAVTRRTPWWRRRVALRPLPAAALAALLLALGVAAGTPGGRRRRRGRRPRAGADARRAARRRGVRHGAAGGRRRAGDAAPHRPAPEPRRRLLRALAAQRARRPRLARLVHRAGVGRGRRQRPRARRHARLRRPRHLGRAAPTATRPTPRARCCGRRSSGPSPPRPRRRPRRRATRTRARGRRRPTASRRGSRRGSCRGRSA